MPWPVGHEIQMEERRASCPCGWVSLTRVDVAPAVARRAAEWDARNHLSAVMIFGAARPPAHRILDTAPGGSSPLTLDD